MGLFGRRRRARRGQRGWKSAKEARLVADRETDLSDFRRRKDAAKRRGVGR
jgi:hypothetical protein